MHEYTQGVCADGVVILKDGQMMTIEQIISALDERDRLRSAGCHAYVVLSKQKDEESQIAALTLCDIIWPNV